MEMKYRYTTNADREITGWVPDARGYDLDERFKTRLPILEDPTGRLLYKLVDEETGEIELVKRVGD